MRDKDHFLQLGFEHGYDRVQPSYPGNAPYDLGHREGSRFRDKVDRLRPVLVRNPADTYTVTFPYSLSHLKAAEVPDLRVGMPGLPRKSP